jgi:hypothetical protein
LAIDPKVVGGLLTSYENLTARVRKGDLDAALAEGGKFVEHALRAVEFIRTGVAPPEIKAPHQTVRDIEKDTTLPEGLRVLIPRIAHSMIYDIRGKRGAIHVKEIDPRAIDAALCVQAASWVMAEFLRQYHDGDERAVVLAMETLMRPHVPFIEQFGDEHVVARKVPSDVELLLLLSREASQGLEHCDIRFPGSKEIEEIDTSVFASLRYAQKRQIFFNALLCRRSCNDIAKSRERLDRVLGIVVVPGNIIVAKERE